MKRHAALIAIAAFLVGAAPPQHKADPLLGNWEVVSAKATSKKLSWLAQAEELSFRKAEAARGIPDTVAVASKDGRLFVFDYRLRLARTPPGIDLILSTFLGDAERFRGIFIVQGERLKICISQPGEERPTDFAPKAGTSRLLLILKHQL